MTHKEVRTRFAPSPTGFMHLGNLRTALFAFLFARHNNGKFILRIEDTDQKREVPGAREYIYTLLRRLNLTYDEGPDIGGPYGPYIQSERKPIYKEYAEKLVELGHAYYCFCPAEKHDDTNAHHDEEPKPLGRTTCACRNMPKDEAKRRAEAGELYAIRQRIPEEGSTTYIDAVYGSVTWEHKDLDDQVLLKSDGLPTYNFANVIDDHLMHITHVMRGCEYISSTPKYELLYRAFGWDSPVYVHLPLITKEGGQKLSKRYGDAFFDDFAQKGYLDEAILNYIALLGWSPKDDREILSMQEMIEAFSIEGINKSAAVFDIKKLSWMNGVYIRKLSLEEFHSRALPYYEPLKEKYGNVLLKISQILQPRTDYFAQIPSLVEFLLNPLPENYDLNLYEHKKLKSTKETSKTVLATILPLLKQVETWDAETLEKITHAQAEQLGYKIGQFMWPIRLALTGLAVTPGGATELLIIFGKEESLARIQHGLTRLQNEG